MHHIFIHVQGRKREELAPTASGPLYQKSFPEYLPFISLVRTGLHGQP